MEVHPETLASTPSPLPEKNQKKITREVNVNEIQRNKLLSLYPERITGIPLERGALSPFASAHVGV